MKQGRSLTELAEEVQRRAEVKKDYVSPGHAITMADTGDHLKLHGIPDTLQINELCHDQIAGRLKVPREYYDRMRTEAPALLSQNVNHWFNVAQREVKERGSRQRRGVPAREATTRLETRRFMIRTLDGWARALLSSGYRPLDYEDLMEAVLPSMLRSGCNVVSGEVTERRLYIKAVSPTLQARVVGEVVEAGVCIQNSEVGRGRVSVQGLARILSCDNGMITDVGMQRTHVGRGLGGDDEEASEFFRDETRQADDEAFWMKVRDTVDAVLTEETFGKIMGRILTSTEQRIEDDPVQVIERTRKKFDLTEDEGGSILRHLIDRKDLTAFGLSNAITRASQDIESYDRATKLERMGGQVIELPRSEWSVLASKN